MYILIFAEACVFGNLLTLFRLLPLPPFVWDNIWLEVTRAAQLPAINSPVDHLNYLIHKRMHRLFFRTP